ncbi:MAG: acyl carrier protein [Acidobacteria bacterium]|nr:acyl carrier protein [Acidobacteriota bacterium]
MGEYLERDVSHVTMDSRLDAIIPGLDSLKIFEMILYLEDCFAVDFDQPALANVDTMRELIDHIESRLALKSATS